MNDKLDKYVVTYEGNSIYDFDNRILLRWYPQRIMAHTQGKDSLLELGLGHGFAALEFSGHFARHVILEGSPAVVANFRKHTPAFRAEIVETYFEEYETKEKFDVIVMGFVFEHVDNPVKLLQKFKDHLVPGGKVYVAVPNAESMNRRLGHYAGLLPDLFQLSPNDIDSGHQRYYTKESIQKDVRSAGGHVNRIEGLFLKPLMTSQLLSLKLDEKIINAMCQLGVGYPELSLGILVEVSF